MVFKGARASVAGLGPCRELVSTHWHLFCTGKIEGSKCLLLLPRKALTYALPDFPLENFGISFETNSSRFESAVSFGMSMTSMLVELEN